MALASTAARALGQPAMSHGSPDDARMECPANRSARPQSKTLSDLVEAAGECRRIQAAWHCTAKRAVQTLHTRESLAQASRCETSVRGVAGQHYQPVLAKAQIRSPKSEGRKKAETRNPKCSSVASAFGIRIWQGWRRMVPAQWPKPRVPRCSAATTARATAPSQ